MEKTTLWRIRDRFMDYNKEHGNTYSSPKKDLPELSAVIVYKASNFTKPYTEKERSYRVTNNDGKAFFEGMLGNSIWGDCLDGKDLRVRLDRHEWEIEYAYFEN